MKNACLILTNKSGVLGQTEVLSIFENAGYDFSEIRIFRRFEEELIKVAIEESKRSVDNIVVFVSGYSLLLLLETIEKAFGKGFLRTSANGSGILIDGEKTLFLLPYDDKIYAHDVCLPYLKQKYGRRTGCLVFRCVGVEENRMQGLISRAEEFSSEQLKIRRESKFGEDVLRVFYDENTPRMLTDDLVRFFAKELGENLYALDDTPLEKQLIDLLRLRRKKLCVAESFTGGGLAKRIVSVSGASEVYYEGLNTYADGSKMRRLGVTEFTLRSHGAVSEQTAYEMAAGLLEQGNCNVSIATTGLAGPKDDGSGLPIGTCHIAIGIDDNVYVYRYVLQGDREEITETAIRYALFLACRQLKNV
jgi:nicotinamide-nucleotide amidase